MNKYLKYFSMYSKVFVIVFVIPQEYLYLNTFQCIRKYL